MADPRPARTALTLEATRQPFWTMGVPEALAALKTGMAGLAEDEALARRAVFGSNEIHERPRLTHIRILGRQFSNPLILVLVAAGVITVFLGLWVETGVIFAAVAVNAALGFWQEAKAETALALLKSYVRTRTRVRRQEAGASREAGTPVSGGAEREVDAADLVPGDIIRVSQGDRVPADARVIFANTLEVDEAVLTGESLPVAKDVTPLPASTALGERRSMLFSGTLAVGGFGDAVITATGSRSEFGRIAALVAERERIPTPLQRSLARFVSRAGGALLVLVVALFAFGLWAGYGLFEMFLIAVAVAVSAVPEGLPVALTVILAIGVERLARRKGIVRKLLAAETLGSTSVILTDKTGTLTQARMELSAVLPYGRPLRSAAPAPREAEVELLRLLLGNLDVVIENPADPPLSWRIVGPPIEAALVRGAATRGVSFLGERGTIEVLDRLPFSSAHKFSASVVRSGPRRRLVLLGAPDVLLGFTALPFEPRSRLLEDIDHRARSGERVLGVAAAEVPAAEARVPRGRPFPQLEFYGLVAFRDPLRPEVAGAIRRIAEAGVKTVIVTGDHRGTAEAVARELGMMGGPARGPDGQSAVMTGNDLKYLSPDELRARADHVAVYARVTPEEKLALVKLYRQKGETVAVTGDGVNDAPALQAADIGVAVGSGTDVAKSASDLVLLDDNFGTLVVAIEEGRKILANIRKVIVYLLSDSLDELFLIGGALLAGVALPLNALQILFVNFFSDSFPAIALALEEGADGFEGRPRRLGPNLLDRTVRVLVLVIGVLTSFLLFVLYYLLLRAGFDPALVRTFTFASFATYTLFLAFSVRSLERSILSYNPLGNRSLVGGVLIGFILTAAVVYLPALQGIFGTVALPGRWALGVLGVGLANIALVEFGKWLLRRTPAGTGP